MNKEKAKKITYEAKKKTWLINTLSKMGFITNDIGECGMWLKLPNCDSAKIYMPVAYSLQLYKNGKKLDEEFTSYPKALRAARAIVRDSLSPCVVDICISNARLRRVVLEGGRPLLLPNTALVEVFDVV